MLHPYQQRKRLKEIQRRAAANIETLGNANSSTKKGLTFFNIPNRIHRPKKTPRVLLKSETNIDKDESDSSSEYEETCEMEKGEDKDDENTKETSLPEFNVGIYADTLDPILPSTRNIYTAFLLKDTHYIALMHGLRENLLNRNIVGTTALLHALSSFKDVPVEIVWKYTAEILRNSTLMGLGAHEYAHFLRSLSSVYSPIKLQLDLELAYYLILQNDPDSLQEAYDLLEPMAMLMPHSDCPKILKTLGDISYVLWEKEIRRLATSTMTSESMSQRTHAQYSYNHHHSTQSALLNNSQDTNNFASNQSQYLSQQPYHRGFPSSRASKFFSTAEKSFNKLLTVLDPDHNIDSLPIYVHLLLNSPENVQPAPIIGGDSTIEVDMHVEELEHKMVIDTRNITKARMFLQQYVWGDTDDLVSGNRVSKRSRTNVERPHRRYAPALKILYDFLTTHFPNDPLIIHVLERLLEVDPRVNWKTYYTPFIEMCMADASEDSDWVPPRTTQAALGAFARRIDCSLCEYHDWSAGGRTMTTSKAKEENEVPELIIVFEGLANLLHICRTQFNTDCTTLWPQRRLWWCRFFFPAYFIAAQRSQLQCELPTDHSESTHLQLKLLKSIVCIQLGLHDYHIIKKRLWCNPEKDIDTATLVNYDISIHEIS